MMPWRGGLHRRGMPGATVLAGIDELTTERGLVTSETVTAVRTAGEAG